MTILEYITQKAKIRKNRRRWCKDHNFSYFIWNLYHLEDKIIKGDGYCIHHKDRNPLNDNISNLEKVLTKKHSSFHMLGRKGSEKHRLIMLNNTYRLGKECSSETKLEISKSHIGKTHSEKTKQKMSQARKRYWDSKKYAHT